MDYSKVLAQEFDIKEEYAQNVIALLDDGNTIPFIARYRKEMHGSMDDQLIRAFSEKLRSPNRSTRRRRSASWRISTVRSSPSARRVRASPRKRDSSRSRLSSSGRKRAVTPTRPQQISSMRKRA